MNLLHFVLFSIQRIRRAQFGQPAKALCPQCRTSCAVASPLKNCFITETHKFGQVKLDLLDIDGRLRFLQVVKVTSSASKVG